MRIVNIRDREEIPTLFVEVALDDYVILAIEEEVGSAGLTHGCIDVPPIAILNHGVVSQHGSLGLMKQSPKANNYFP